MKRFKFSLKTTLICSILALLMIRAAFWQAARYEEKQRLIVVLTSRLEIPPVKINSEIDNINKTPENYIHRKFEIEGQFDFANEIVLKNRRHNGVPGDFVITPLKISNSDMSVMVSRGFIPNKLSTQEKRKEFQKEVDAHFIGLSKATVKPKFFLAPQDKLPPNESRIDSWLRVDLEKIQKQLNYKILPIYLEIMEFNKTNQETIKNMVKSDSDKSDMLLMPLRANSLKANIKEDYPVIVYDTYIPPGRHYAYIYEWSTMALMTLLIGFILQFRRQ